MKLLIVEDEEKLREALVAGLRMRGYSVESASDGIEGEKTALLGAYDAIILDVMMPGRDGTEVCRNLRAQGKTMPIIMLTAKDARDDIIYGLDSGADDYVLKPFSFEELLARVRSVLRRPRAYTNDTIVFDELSLDTGRQEVMVKEKKIDLTLREYALLECLLRNQGIVFTREDLLERVWDRNFDSFSNVVDVHIKNLRKKLPTKYAKHIETIWGKGYRFV